MPPASNPTPQAPLNGAENNVNPTPSVQPPVTPVSASVPSQQPPVQAPKKSRTGLIIGIIVGVVVLIIGALLALYFLFINSASYQTNSRSLAFMNAMAEGNVDEAFKYTNGNPENRTFLESMAPSVKANAVGIKDSAERNDRWYYLYSLEGGQSTAARTELVKEEGKWVVTTLVSGGENLALVPGNSAEQEEPSATTASSNCLVQSDFDNWYKSGIGLGKTTTESGIDFSKNGYTTNVKFQPDALTYDGAQVQESFVTNVAKLAKEIEGKTFTIRLNGSVATTAAADLEFANKRAEKVKNDLIAQGVPASKITIDPPQSVKSLGGSESSDDVTRQMSRNVVIKVDPTCSGSSTGR